MRYFIAIGNESQIDIVGLERNLNLALDWIQIMPNVFIVKSNKTKELWHARIKSVTNNNLFFITEISLNNNFNGWLYPKTWEWINKNKP
ncbi:MAG: hypothetical protein LE178_00455 [Endomicrobium sp.]|nr:hypothetical protein [Endomicrobium sp.]